MIPGDFHQYKIRSEPLGFSIFCMHVDFIFNFFLLVGFEGTPHGEPETPSVTLDAGTAGDFEGTQAREGDTLQCQKC